MPGTHFISGSQVRFATFAHEQVTVGGTATGLPNLPADWANKIYRVVIRSLAGDINIRDDGTDPTTTTGFPVLKDETLVYDGDDLTKLRLIRADSSPADADVRVWYMGG